MSLREEFVLLALQPGANRRELCRRFGIVADTGYRLLARYQAEGLAGLAYRSRRPKRSPRQTSPELETVVLTLRAQHPTWGGRKLAARLRTLGHADIPAASTITAILRRHGRLDPSRAGQPRAYQRFEHDAANELWQMDFKGHIPCGPGRCHPLTVLDDHSRYSLALAACANERTNTVQQRLITTFPPLRPAPHAARRQRAAVGRSWRPARLHPAHRLAAAARHAGRTQPPVPPPDAGQRRTLPLHAEGGAARRTAVRPRLRAAPLRPLAPGLQPRATARGAGRRRAGQPLPFEPAGVSGVAAAGRVPGRGPRAQGPGPGPRRLPWRAAAGAAGVSWLSRRTPSARRGRPLSWRCSRRRSCSPRARRA